MRALALLVVAFVGLPASGALGPATPVPTVKLDAAAVLDAAHAGSWTLLLPGHTLHFKLEPNPIAVGAVWGRDGEARGVVTEVTTFKGTANGHPARVSLTPLGVFAAVFEPDPLFIEPAWPTVPGAALDLHRFGRWSQYPPTIPAHPERPSQAVYEPGMVADAGADRTVRILVESDFVMWQRWSLLGVCDACWVQTQQAILNFAEFLFERAGTGITFQVTSHWACTTLTACPYPSINQGISSWLTAFMDRWESRTDEPPHDIGHLLISTNLSGTTTGVANTGVVGTPEAYAVSEFAPILPSNSVQSMLGILATATVAHEIGHNFDGVHAEAVPIPPSLGATGATDHVWTIMASGASSSWVKYEFSDGSFDLAKNNLNRIVQHAIERLPPP